MNNMQQIVSRQLVEKLGLDLSDADLERLNHDALDQINKRVIEQIIEELEPAQLAELAQQDPNSPEFELWLEENVPQLEEIVGEETIFVLDEIVRAGEN